MKLKKWLLATLSLICMACMALGFTACGEKPDDGGAEPADVNYTFVLTDQDGGFVVGAQLALMQGQTQIATGTTDANGEMKGTAKEGAYIVKINELPEGYLADAYTVSVTLSTDNGVIALSAINNIPNGTQERPFIFIGDKYGFMEIVVPANTTHYYQIPRPMGRNLTVYGDNFAIIYNDTTYLPTSGETEEIVFTSAADNVYAIEIIAIVNQADVENTLEIALPVPPGSSAEVAIEAQLDTTLTATVKGNKTVYYTWTATANGVLACNAVTEMGSFYLYNENTYGASDWAASVSITVNEGDLILIQVGSGEDDDLEHTVQFMFTFTQA